jgi:hypothetical protein
MSPRTRTTPTANPPGRRPNASSSVVGTSAARPDPTAKSGPAATIRPAEHDRPRQHGRQSHRPDQILRPDRKPRPDQGQPDQIQRPGRTRRVGRIHRPDRQQRPGRRRNPRRGSGHGPSRTAGRLPPRRATPYDGPILSPSHRLTPGAMPHRPSLGRTSQERTGRGAGNSRPRSARQPRPPPSRWRIRRMSRKSSNRRSRPRGGNRRCRPGTTSYSAPEDTADLLSYRDLRCQRDPPSALIV